MWGLGWVFVFTLALVVGLIFVADASWLARRRKLLLVILGLAWAGLLIAHGLLDLGLPLGEGESQMLGIVTLTAPARILLNVVRGRNGPSGVLRGHDHLARPVGREGDLFVGGAGVVRFGWVRTNRCRILPNKQLQTDAALRGG